MNPKYKAAYFEQRFRNRIYETVVRALEGESKENKLKRKDIAARIGKKQSQVSRWLAGPGNWTLDTISDLLFAIDAELDFKVTRFKDKKKKNEFHPLNSTAWPPKVKTPQPETSQTTLDYRRSYVSTQTSSTAL